MKRLLVFTAILLFIPLVFAADLKVEQTENDYLIIKELDNSATFTLDITNKEEVSDNFRIYSLVGATILPRENFSLSSGETKQLEIEIIPNAKVKEDTNGFYSLDYQIKGDQTDYFNGRFAMRIIKFEDAIDISVNNLKIDDTETKIVITNLEKRAFENIDLHVLSDFFEINEIISLDSEEQIKISIPIKLNETKTLEAKDYRVIATLELNNHKIEKAAILKYLERGEVSVSKTSEGFIVKKNSISKTNEGNVEIIVKIESKKNVLSRLFTTYSETPHTSERKGLFVEYAWEKELLPTETYSINSTTNYTLPFIFILIVLIVFFITKFLIRKDLVVKKRVSFVKTKGGEFALKIKLRIKANSLIENIEIADRIPGITKLYEKFGAKPDKIDNKKRKLSWSIKRLNAGEERVFTYIIYSKINVLGRFELPSASAKYEKNGKHEHTFSNKTYFAAESSEHE